MSDIESRDAAARAFLADIEGAMATSYRDPAPLPAIGTTPPVPQPGRPPMSQRATDASALMLSGAVLTIAGGGSIGTVLWASGYADPTTLALIAAAPVGIAVPILAMARLLRSAKQAAPAEQHHHYNAPVTQTTQTQTSTTRGLWASTRNQQPK